MKDYFFLRLSNHTNLPHVLTSVALIISVTSLTLRKRPEFNRYREHNPQDIL